MNAAALGLGAGFVADAILGDPPVSHPVAWFGRGARRLESHMYRPDRATGAAYAVVLMGAFGLFAVGVDRALREVRILRALFVTAVTWSVLGGRSLRHYAGDLAEAVRSGDLEGARSLAPSLVGRDPSELDSAELCRAAIESVAENTADAVVGPLLWGALLGPGGAVVYRVANTLDAMVGHRDPRYERFGWASARSDDVLTWIPARAAACLAVVLAPLVSGDPAGAATTLMQEGSHHPSPNAGRLEAVFAGALGVRLGGRNVYQDRVEDRPIIGSGRPPSPDDVDRAARLSGLIGWAAAALCVALAGRRRG